MIVTSAEGDGKGLTFHREDVMAVRQSAAGVSEVWLRGVAAPLVVSEAVAAEVRAWMLTGPEEAKAAGGETRKKTR